MNILKLIAQLSLDGTRFKAGLREAEVAAKGFAKDIAGAIKGQLAAAFGAYALVNFIKTSFEGVAALKDMAEQARMTTDEVQRMQAAAEDIGLTFADVAQAERAFNQKRKEAVESNKELRATFSKYGMTLEDLQDPQLKFADFMHRASAAMSEMSDSDAARAPTELFDMLGKAGPKIEELVKQLEKVKNLPIVDRATIDAADKAMDDLHRGVRQFGGLIAMAITDPFDAALYDVFRQAQALPEWLRKWMGITGAGYGPKTEPGARSGDMNGPDSSEFFKRQGDKLFEDKIAEKEAKEITEARLKLEEAIFKVKLQQMTATDQRAAKEKRLNEAVAAIYGLEESGFDASKERTEAVGMLGDILNDKPGRADVAGLTKIGQYSGRQFVNAPESPVVKAAKELLTPAKETAASLKSIDGKVKAGKTLGGAL